MANNNQPINLKVVLLGEGCVGKTSLVLRYVEDKFNSNHISTLQASFLNKKLTIGSQRVNIAIWDTAGQEKFHALGPIYYRASNGAVLVYDITDEDSYQRIKGWVKELRKMLGSDVCLVIVGNKTDLEKDRHVRLEDAEAYASKVGALHFQTSAKHNEGIEDVFLALTQRMLDRSTEQEIQTNRSNQNSIRRNVLVVEDDQGVAPSTRTCCHS